MSEPIATVGEVVEVSAYGAVRLLQQQVATLRQERDQAREEAAQWKRLCLRAERGKRQYEVDDHELGGEA